MLKNWTAFENENNYVKIGAGSLCNMLVCPYIAQFFVNILIIIYFFHVLAEKKTVSTCFNYVFKFSIVFVNFNFEMTLKT